MPVPSATAEVAACPRCGRVWAPLYEAPEVCVIDGGRLERRTYAEVPSSSPDGGATRAELGSLERLLPAALERVGELSARLDSLEDVVLEHDRFARSAARAVHGDSVGVERS